MTKELIKTLGDILAAYVSEVYYKDAKDSPGYPYCVFSIPVTDESLRSEGVDYTLEIRIYDKTIDDLVDLVELTDLALDGMNFMNTLVVGHFFKESILELPKNNAVHGYELRYRVDVVVR